MNPNTSPACSIIQESIEWCEAKAVKPGIRKRIWYTSKKNIAKWPDRDRDPWGRCKSASYENESSFVMATGGYWRHIDTYAAKSKATSDPQGEFPSQTQLNKLEVIIPGTGPDESSLCAYVNNTDSVFLVEDNHGRIRVYGSEDYETKSTVTQDLGEGPTGTAQTALSVEASDETLPPFYSGDIQEEPDLGNAMI